MMMIQYIYIYWNTNTLYIPAEFFNPRAVQATKLRGAICDIEADAVGI